MRIQVLVRIVALVLMIASPPLFAYATTISFMEPVAEDGKVGVSAIDGGKDLPVCGEFGNGPCLIKSVMDVESGSAFLRIPPVASLPVGTTASALLLENDKALSPISDLLVLDVIAGSTVNNVEVDVTLASNKDSELGNAPKDFKFGLPESGKPQDVTPKFFTGDLKDPATQKPLFPPDKVPPLTIMAQSDVTVGEPEPSTWLLFGSGLAGICALAWRQRHRR